MRKENKTTVLIKGRQKKKIKKAKNAESQRTTL